MLLPDVSVQVHHELLNMLGHRIPIAARRSISTHAAGQIVYHKACRLADAKAAVKSKCQMTLTYDQSYMKDTAGGVGACGFHLLMLHVKLDCSDPQLSGIHSTASPQTGLT